MIDKMGTRILTLGIRPNEMISNSFCLKDSVAFWLVNAYNIK